MNNKAKQASAHPAQQQEPVIECDCETATSPDGTRLTKCGSDLMRRAVEKGHAFCKQPAQQEPVAWANPGDLQNFDMKVRTNGGPLHTVPLCLCNPAPTQQAARQQEPQGLIRQSEEDFQRFLKTTNLKAINGRKTLAALAWRISHQQTKKRINQMKASQAFDDGGAQDLTILNVHSKNFLKELAVHAREACDVVVPEWAEKYGSLASAAEELVKMIERTEVVHE